MAVCLVCGCRRGPAADVTAYVVAYHWGFGLLDPRGGDLERLEVPLGANVELVAVNQHAEDAIARLPRPVARAVRDINWERRAGRDVEQGLVRDPEEYGTTLAYELAQSHSGHDEGDEHVRSSWMQHGPPPGYADHGLQVTGYRASIARIESHAGRPVRLVFTADRAGEFDFVCLVSCGFGHPHPRRLLVVR